MRNAIFDVSGKVAIVTGGTGVLGGSIAESFLTAGAKVVIIGRNEENVERKIEFFRKKFGEGEVLGYSCNVLDIDRLKIVKRDILDKWNGVDILINCAGGNVKGATLTDQQSFFDMNLDLWDDVLNLNLNGSIYPSFVFGEIMAGRKAGCIINISSMAALTAITRVPGYSSAKAAVDNFTRWLAMEMALKFSDKIRVNAIAPGFFIGNQNRNILLNDDGSLTERSEKVLAKTPMKRFGDITELNGAVQFLCSDAASFITGIVLPVDGGFSIFSGV
ncbi:MAG: SDR family oxidoreductase [Petrimonas sp.]|uniref:SDR family oxidoreductase n=1 Tax=Petrimonas sp. TaxID=2023866 RepID=UPI002B3F69A9|nr:SDR family oxidoreductase [Petrimonas sp.]MEA5043246.1 SDR family oxidoreductase [Petrimonas sp.]